MHNAPEWPWILLGSVCSLINGAGQPMFALFLSRIFRLFAEPNIDEQKRLTNIYAGTIFAIGCVTGLAEFLAGVSFAKSGEALTMRMRKATFSALLRQEIGYFDYETNSVGALVTRLSSDSSALKVRRRYSRFSSTHVVVLFQGLTGVRIGTILQAAGAVLTALIISFASGWKLTLVALCFVPLLLLNGFFHGQKHAHSQSSNEEGSLAEQGGQVRMKNESWLSFKCDVSVCNTSDGPYSNDCLATKGKSFHRTLRKGLHRRHQVGMIDLRLIHFSYSR